MKANAAYGNKTKSYAIVEFLKTNQNTSTELLEKNEDEQMDIKTGASSQFFFV